MHLLLFSVFILEFTLTVHRFRDEIVHTELIIILTRLLNSTIPYEKEKYLLVIDLH